MRVSYVIALQTVVHQSLWTTFSIQACHAQGTCKKSGVSETYCMHVAAGQLESYP